jgi:hypothetical protein
MPRLSLCYVYLYTILISYAISIPTLSFVSVLCLSLCCICLYAMSIFTTCTNHQLCCIVRINQELSVYVFLLFSFFFPSYLEGGTEGSESSIEIECKR